jgi:dethiobiotin synthetase
MSRNTRFQKHYSNTGLGKTPSPSSIRGLLQCARHRGQYYKQVRAELLAKAKAGDEVALFKLKKMHLSQHAASATRKRKVTITKVPLTFLREDEHD